MSKKPILSPADKALFDEAMKNVTPLKHKKNKVVFEPKRPKIKSQNIDEPPIEETHIFLTDPSMLDIQAETILSFHRAGLNERLLKKLRRGEVTIDAMLDLHQHTIEQARIALSSFLQTSFDNGLRFIRIIHGKGQRESDYARLKTFINHWLPQFNFVLAFHSCPPNQGGTGAVIVLLKK